MRTSGAGAGTGVFSPEKVLSKLVCHSRRCPPVRVFVALDVRGMNGLCVSVDATLCLSVCVLFALSCLTFSMFP